MKKKDGRSKNGNKDFAKLRPKTPNPKKYGDVDKVKINFSVHPTTLQALRDWRLQNPKSKGGYGSLIEKLVREYFELTEI